MTDTCQTRFGGHPTSHDAAQSLSAQHQPVLDGIRGLAVLLVMLLHFNLLQEGGSVPANNHAGQWAIDWTHRLLSVGWCGVDLFFVLSGYLITGILLDAKSSAIACNSSTPEARPYFTSFYLRRVLRIFPLYYAAILLLLVLVPLIPHAKAQPYAELAQHQAWFWTYLSNWHFAFGGRGFTGDITDVFWSLAIEEQFYMVWPAVVWLAPRRTLTKLCLGLAAGALILRLAMWAGGSPAVAIYVLTPARMDALALGALLAALQRGPHGLAPWLSILRWAAVAAGLVLITILAIEGRLLHHAPLVQTLGYSAVALLFAGMLATAVVRSHDSIPGRLFNLRFLRHLGFYCYGLYIGHLFVRAGLWNLGLDLRNLTAVTGHPLLAQLLFATLGITASLLMAWLSWHLLEKHCMKAKRWLPYTRPRIAVQPLARISPSPSLKQAA